MAAATGPVGGQARVASSGSRSVPPGGRGSGAWRTDYPRDDQLMPKSVLLQRDNIAGLKREITREITSITVKRGDATLPCPLMDEEDNDEIEQEEERRRRRIMDSTHWIVTKKKYIYVRGTVMYKA